MPRATSGAATARKRRRLRAEAKGFRGGRSKLTRVMKMALLKSRSYATRDRRAKKREFRALWITRITAACRARGISYSRFMNGLRKLSISLDRKMLSQLAIQDPAAFDKLVAMVPKA
ncbi:MAG TPA: 50S ribosomal protein L20 [Phycisphaerae bacterium]|jgi:large subunit ribosomal protein L20|nr:50S ribosomal protein L20 [Phycisphaerae bacterium]HOB73652.1 50S ribosomal protein L20 [Phycisphaerae bacterium]HOJ54743.1 50S ribosomal protein L20 [Phycisphaerae bacterium]HOL25906.1 50S ribosomal protein L20 [Phycisphaerae bacterium]HPP21162.1 50S ribosomal protein L20 [Phycisphaerae bacterium]